MHRKTHGDPTRRQGLRERERKTEGQREGTQRGRQKGRHRRGEERWGDRKKGKLKHQNFLISKSKQAGCPQHAPHVAAAVPCVLISLQNVP